MCTGLTIAALAAMAGGQALQMKAQNKAAKRQTAAVVEGAKRQSKVLDDKRSMTMQNLEQYSPEVRQAAQADAATQAEEGLVGELIKAKDAGATIPETNGNVSNEYKTNLARAVTGEMDRASKLAALMSKFRAPNDLRFKENLSNADYASRQGGLDSIGRSYAATDDYLIGQAGKPDPRMMFLGGLMSSAGGAYAGGQIMSGLGAGAGAGSSAAKTMAVPDSFFFAP